MVIDEIQRVPELLLAIKEQVDADPRPGRYLLTGSARVLGLRGLPDTLPGRTETIELWPLAQGELDGTADRFIDAVFDRGGRADPRIRGDPAGIRRAHRPRRFSGGGGQDEPTPSRALLRLLPRRSRRARRQPAVRHRTHPRDAGPDPHAGGPFRPAAGRQRGGQRSRAPGQHRPPVRGPAGRGLPDQADPGLVAERQRTCRGDAQAGLRRLGDRGQPAGRGRAEPAAARRAVRAPAGRIRPDGAGPAAHLVAAARRAVPLPHQGQGRGRRGPGEPSGTRRRDRDQGLLDGRGGGLPRPAAPGRTDRR